jgi:RHS repeat-associated protein
VIDKFLKKSIYLHLFRPLGNVRVSYSKNANGSAEVLEENNFYPFGLKHEGYNVLTGNPAYNYQYHGKEYQKETGWSDYGARMYMPDIARWGVIDPLAETSRRFNPYNYAYNNPISFIDPDGRKALAVDEGWSWNVSTSSGWFNSGSSFGSFYEFTDLKSGFEKERGSGGNGASTFGETDLGKAIMAFIYFGNIDFNSSPPNEYEVDLKTGKTRQISDLGGDEIDFYHYTGGGAGFNGRTRIVDRETGQDQWMKSSKNIKGYNHRGSNVDWDLLYDEFLQGSGPENSLLIGKGSSAVKKLINTQIYLDAATDFMNTSMNEKSKYDASFGPWGAVRENFNMQGQFMGKTNFSFYPVGNKVVIMAFDSKSISSYSLNPFNKGESRNIPRRNGIGIPQSTTYQTYIWWTTKNNLFK